MFEYADSAIRAMNRRNIKSFKKLRQLKFDELNILNDVSDIYDGIERMAKKRFYEIARQAYIDALTALGIAERKAKEMADEEITEDFIIEMLDEYDPVTLYQFTPEIERKKERLIEALIASHNKVSEIDKALRYITLQLSQYADKAELEATLQAYKDAGIKKVIWITMEDERVCNTCNARDGKVYAINRVPPRPHYRCRCEIEPTEKPVDSDKDDDIITISGKSLGAKAKKREAWNPKTQEYVELVDGKPLTQPKNHIIAGKGRNNAINDIDWLMNRYPGDEEWQWVKEKGFGYVYDEYGEARLVELHWYSSKSYDKVEMKIKVQYDGEIYLD